MQPIKTMNTAGEFTIRRAFLEDAATIVLHRYGMFRDMGYSDEAALASMSDRFLPWLQAKMKSDEYLGWFAVDAAGSVIAGAGLWLMDWPPHMLGSSRRGNIVNVFTAREFRRRGMARVLMQTALDWCRQNGVDLVILHASADGRKLYESMGFAESNEMRMKL